MNRPTMRSMMIPVAAMAALGGLAAGRANADQPYMHDALDQLRGARAALAGGAPDKGGHRVRAIALVDRAISEVRMGIDFDRGH